MRCDLLFFRAKEEEEKDKKWGLHVAVHVRANVLGEGGRVQVRCGADGGGVGARVVVGYRAKRASERYE